MEAATEMPRKPPASGSEGEAVVGPLTEPLERFRSKDLRREVYRLKLRVVRKGADANDHKNGYMELLRAYWAKMGLNASRVENSEAKQTLAPEEVRGAASQHKETLGICDLGFTPPDAYDTLDDHAQEPQLHVENAGGESARDIEMSAHEEGYIVTPSPGALYMVSEMGTTQEEIESSYSTDGEFGHYGANMDQRTTSENLTSCRPADGEVKRVPFGQAPSRPPRLNQPRGYRGEAVWKMPSDRLAFLEDTDAFDKMMKRKAYWEERLTLSKRKMRDLQEELRRMDQVYDQDLLQHELSYYKRERKRALRSLLEASEVDH